MNMTAPPAHAALDATLARQRAACLAHPVPTFAERKRDLQTLQRYIRDHKLALCEAISADYGNRSHHETLLAEIFPDIDGIPVMKSLATIAEPVHTLTLYVGPERSQGMVEDIVALRPGRVIFNPGTESPALEERLTAVGIPHERACTLVLLRTGQF